MPFDHSSAQESQVRLTHPQWQQHGSVTELKLRVLYVFHTQGFAVSPDPAPSTLWGTLQRERFLPPTHGRPLCGVNASFLVPKAKDSRREPGIPSGAVGDTEQLLFSFLGHLARQKKKKKALLFPPGKRKKKNKGSFLLDTVGDALEAETTPELKEKGFVQWWGRLSSGVL